MKALQLVKYGSPEEAFQINELKDPVPGEGELIIQTECFGLNYADVMARNGLYNDAPPLPCTLGYEVVGEVEKTGEGVTKFAPGDRVLAFTRFGGYAQKALADERTVAKLPPEIPSAKALALATQYCTAYYAAIRMANIQKNERVLIHACAGGVGLALLDLAKHTGCETIGTAGSDNKIEFIKSRGVNHAINYRRHHFGDEIQKTFDTEKPVDAAFDAIGGKTYQHTKKLLNFGGRHVIFGVASRKTEGFKLLNTLKLAWGFGLTHPLEFLLGSRGVIGLNMLRIAEEKPSVLGEIMEKLIKMYLSGDVQPHIFKSYNIQEINEAHHALENRQTIGKVVVFW